MAVEAVRAGRDDLEWAELVRECLYDNTTPFPSALHLAVARLVALRPEDSTRLFTLNFDTLLEQAIESALIEVGRSSASFPRGSATPRAPAGAVEVHHLHGVVPESPEAPVRDVILGLSDYTALSSSPWQRGELEQALQRGPLIMAGTSYRDPDIRNWIYSLTRDRGHGQVAVLIARAGLGLSRPQYVSVTSALVEQWNRVGVRPILLQDHADAAQILRELSSLHDDGYMPPRQRARALWGRCMANFDDLQRAHADALAHDRNVLQEKLGSDANVTLWLADGSGHLVRWSSPDRVYKSVDELRRVPLGFDSPWIAGQCLAVDDVMAKEPAEDPGETRRWRSVVASPVTVTLPGGPPLATAVISSATSDRLDAHDLDGWSASIEEAANRWSEVLGELGVSLS